MNGRNHSSIIRNIFVAGVGLIVTYSIMKLATEKGKKPETNEEKVHLKEIKIYEGKIKPALDRILSFGGIVLFSPLYILISLAVYLDDPGPIFFVQKRVGKDKNLFWLHKFRTMKVSAPHNVPTHQLNNPEQYITRIGKILRKTSLDELPQIWDIFRGKMSVIGPRPALWNQEDLVLEREKYGANELLPGLTGWAQINGRDELEISEKARLDGEYVKNLRQGGIKAFLFDVKCFLGTIYSVMISKGIVEGGTGKIQKNSMEDIGSENVESEDYGYRKSFHIDKSVHKHILITGANSYVGESFKTYAEKEYSNNFSIDVADTTNENWRKTDFSLYDTVFHVAGIAHVDLNISDEKTKEKYYAVNTDLAIEIAQLAKNAGIKQFVFMSSVIIYGEAAPFGKIMLIDEHTKPAPANFYGDSKWQADKGIRNLKNENFHVAVLRPPMIYGRGSKGNYQILAKIAKIFPFFPSIKNQRSMLFIDNLCEFLCLLILSGEGGIYFPQNKEYVNTAMLVKTINQVTGKFIYNSYFLNFPVMIASRIPGRVSALVNKAFGNSVIDKKMSIYDGLKYHVKTFKESIELTEGSKCAVSKEEKNAVLILVNHDVVIYNFRLELVERLLNNGYEVHISSPYGERIDDLIALGAKYHNIVINRHGVNPVTEISVLREYKKLIKAIKPIIILGYTIKPNIYGSIAAKIMNVPFVANITGLGTAVGKKGVGQKLISMLYQFAFRDVQTVFFQNTEDMQFFKERNIAIERHKLLPGSGVNLERFPFQLYPECGDGNTGKKIRFAFISRIMKEKGIEQYLTAAEAVKKLYPDTEFHVCGFCEPEYKGRLEELNNNRIVIYHGMIRDVARFIRMIHCVVLPTYYPEGISNVLLEACSSGRPIITTNRSGCREVVEDGVNGYMIPERNTEELVKAIERFIKLDNNEKMDMGLKGRKKVEKEFNREIVINAYMQEITKIKVLNE